MNTRELLEFECHEVGKQIEVCFDGISEAALDTRCSAKGMTPREIIVHLSEAHTAFLAMTRGEKHKWGSYRVEDQSLSNLLSNFREVRGKAVEAGLASEDDAVIKGVYEYIVGHDNYHVSQLVLARMQVDLDWDADGIYG